MPNRINIMGKIKSKMVRRTANTLLEKGIEFGEEFNKNKKILGKTMPSKKVRNQIAGFLVRTKRQQNKKEKELLKK